MSEFTIYHNPRCSKSRQTLALIEERDHDAINIIKYLETPPTVEALAQLLKQLDKAPQDIVRKGEAIYKELGLADKTLTEQQWLEILSEHPKLIERPIVVCGDKAVLGRPPENVLSFFE